MAIPIRAVLCHLIVDQRSDWYWRPVFWLRNNAIADRVDRQPFVCREELWLPRYRQTLVNDPPRHLIPGRRVALAENIIAWVSITHQDDPPAGQVPPGRQERGR